MGSLVLRSKVWYYYYTNPITGERVGEPTEYDKSYTKGQLKDYKHNRDHEVRCLKHGFANTDISLDGLIQAFYTTKKAEGKEEATFKAYSHAFCLLKSKFPHIKRAKDHTTDTITAFITKRQQDGVTPRTIVSEMERIRALFNFAVDKKYLPLSPCKGVRDPKVQARTPEFCTIDEYKRVYRMACTYKEDCWRDAVYIAPRTSMRPQEIRKLSWDKVDLEGRVIVNYNPKTNIITTIPINNSLFNHLTEMKERVKGDYLIAYKDGTRPDQGTFSKVMRDIFNKAGLPDYSFKTLRHTAATKILKSGKFELSEIGKLMGHKKTSTTQIYAHVLPERLKAMTEELDFD